MPPVPEPRTASVTPFVLIVVAVLVVGGWLGWRTWNSPYDEPGAGVIGTQATEVLVHAASGDSSQCESMRTMSRPGDEDAAVARCHDAAARYASGPGPLAVGQLHVEGVDVDRDSGTVTVAGNLVNPGPVRQLRVTWPLSRSGDGWRLAGVPEIHVE